MTGGGRGWGGRRGPYVEVFRAAVAGEQGAADDDDDNGVAAS